MADRRLALVGCHQSMPNRRTPIDRGRRVQITPAVVALWKRGQENIWQFMRQNWLSNRIFKSFDDIVDHCCYAWNTLIDQPWKIMSIARRDWVVAGHSI